MFKFILFTALLISSSVGAVELDKGLSIESEMLAYCEEEAVKVAESFHDNRGNFLPYRSEVISRRLRVSSKVGNQTITDLSYIVDTENYSQSVVQRAEVWLSLDCKKVLAKVPYGYTVRER